MCKLLRTVTSVKTELSWNRSYQQLYEKLINEDPCMKFYDEKNHYTEIDGLGVGIGVGLYR